MLKPCLAVCVGQAPQLPFKGAERGKHLFLPLLSAPVIKCKKTPVKKCSFEAEVRKKDRLQTGQKALERSQEMKGAQWMDIRSDRQKGLS